MRQILLAALCLLYLSAAPVHAQQETYYIKVKSTKLRSSMQHFGGAVTSLKLGDAVKGTEATDGWYKVTTSSKKTGYLHESVLSDKKIITANSKYNAASDSSDVVLAGKGFNKEVEKQYAAQNKNLNFGEVNKMDAITVNDSELSSFIKSGGLRNG